MENVIKARVYDTLESDTYHIIDDIETVGAIGVIDHNQLQNLDYEHSGHTGFVSAKTFNQHIETVNPHHITCEMIGAAPANMTNIPQVPIATISIDKGYIYVDNDGERGKVSINDMKNMNTKIISADDETDIRISKLSQDDFVYIKNN